MKFKLLEMIQFRFCFIAVNPIKPEAYVLDCEMIDMEEFPRLMETIISIIYG